MYLKLKTCIGNADGWPIPHQTLFSFVYLSLRMMADRVPPPEN